MMVSFNPLWHTLLDKGMKKLELCEAADISTATLAKLGKNENVNVNIIDKICIALNCRVEDVIEILPNDTP
ncbi:MAG: helix-turn-helix transcriptional regulator [Eubacterium sp.]|nr:helix-turn-helix transcriptional regulator [Eubacterium sp.]